MFNFEDSRTLTDKERRCLTQLMYMAFIEMRTLTLDVKRCEQAYDLADAFHNVPLQLYGDKFSIPWFLKCLEHYQEKYKSSRVVDFIAEWNRLITATP